MREAARCYRCDAETGSTDYSVHHREDLFSMARTHPKDVDKHRAMLQRRLNPRDNPYPDERPASLDDLVFLPANLSRLVIDPYREACRIDIDLGPDLNLKQPFLVSGLDDAPEEVRQVAWRAAEDNGAGVVSRSMPDGSVHWLQILEAGETAHSRAVKEAGLGVEKLVRTPLPPMVGLVGRSHRIHEEREIFRCLEYPFFPDRDG